ncbi:hypothetical protein BV898_08336 [Hypsibius exemplaris]|uniref:Uncharacterized protein n=1 Tax=Hypsibius exemplaris TaxID=2072580 RepID=A0A1W0WQT5_HYPEX|nr:hypothetical protein BV898_08336 [Hypsibius exemplaris]
MFQFGTFCLLFLLHCTSPSYADDRPREHGSRLQEIPTDPEISLTSPLIPQPENREIAKRYFFLNTVPHWKQTARSQLQPKQSGDVAPTSRHHGFSFVTSGSGRRYLMMTKQQQQRRQPELTVTAEHAPVVREHAPVVREQREVMLRVPGVALSSVPARKKPLVPAPRQVFLSRGWGPSGAKRSFA